MTLVTQNLHLAYQKKIVVENLTLTIPHNKIIALIGPNGCGKSTLLKSLARLHKPKIGKITYQQTDIWQKNAKDYAQILSFLPQQHFIPEGIRVKELVAYGRTPYLNLWGGLSSKDKKIIAQAMEITKITSLADCFVTDLSGGQQQRVFLAMTLTQNTEIVLLDEPTTYLDLSYQAELMLIMRKLQQQGKTLITVLHDLNQACRYCDHLIVLKQGKYVTQGSPKEVMTSDLLQQVFDLNAEIHLDPISKTPMFILR
ncbi:Fe(3+) dicitrate ABC transporter ATP-binding protein FecE [Histophilus somni]|uniref:Fe(3+) dicitrate ABC transporter ATP-binding protein FecE n=1 Tax=Histophilus somni TaxID=731 RepID=A0A9Q7E778_HISSO|nr:Fe(3+) dicitrate ABC transporter ATP-binding protein FecE [Histophilus somni]ARU65543.1 ferric citrate ABC transporter ATP-binding protein FecE [Histophilus somni]ARU67412.1 ferric citrate ABC transporter ATP-binding protein FecE [Histophilus somni]ARU69293.1 ferric citrate ABC transporter ATP-binding protein FecE [Histophilus somni]ARU71170.1 ferric citrate ABC transporter ATP-binding protein FecE [Histophilus somni]ARU73041.1 ferric citrate ABC transporter ATP-binding protein FecE [Histop